MERSGATASRVTTGHRDGVWSVAFSPDGKTLAAGSADDTISLWDVSTQHQLKILKGHGAAMPSVAFFSFFTVLAGNDYQAVNLWNVITGQNVMTIALAPDDAQSVAFSLDNKFLVVGCYSGAVRLWEISSRKELIRFKGHAAPVNTVAVSSDGRTLATGSRDKTVNCGM
jgi:WD40 repeat protein